MLDTPAVTATATRVFAIYQILLGWKTYRCYYETDDSPTQGQPNLRKSRLNLAFGSLLPTANTFSWVEIGII